MQSESSCEPRWDADRVCLGRHFVRDMARLWGEILQLATVVESALGTSIRAFCDGRADLAADVRRGEREIDSWEVRIEQQCLKVLALHQPVASDLRRVAVVFKINGDLERMADLAVHIAKRTEKLTSASQILHVPQRLGTMAGEALGAVHSSLDALNKGDADLARAVITSDSRFDLHRSAVSKELKQAIQQNPELVSMWLRLINTARNFERVADHATNIAEAVVYLKDGEIIRHNDVGVA